MGTNFFLGKFEKVENRKSAIKPIKNIKSQIFERVCPRDGSEYFFYAKRNPSQNFVGTFFLGKKAPHILLGTFYLNNIFLKFNNKQGDHKDTRKSSGHADWCDIIGWDAAKKIETNAYSIFLKYKCEFVYSLTHRYTTSL